ncbi:glycosyl transferase [Pedobacter sp.]|uniref:glycosyl transferase n=1 Tax=Pedobacter sp. TaxID=1411316 RepID=UPI003D7FBE31
MLSFCTLFNTTYLSRGLAMYQSLEKQCADFHLYIFAFDNHCFKLLSDLNLSCATIISLKEFENERLLAVKPSRTAGEYCWTCASSTIKFCLETFKLEHCTYIDADLLFFKDPAVLIAEMGNKSVLITEHRYTPCHDQTEKSGKYCVQFMTFKHTTEGMEVLNWWVDACINWCFNLFEDGKFGDQKYLDDWQSKFSTVHVLKHLGGGVAPWNVQQYSFKTSEKQVIGEEILTGEQFDLVFYHYHDFHYTRNNSYSLSNKAYKILRNPVKHIYRPYSRSLSMAEKTIRGQQKDIIPHEITDDIQWVKEVLGRSLLFFLRGYYKNIYKKNALNFGFLN